jgi:hypothetical protein
VGRPRWRRYWCSGAECRSDGSDGSDDSDNKEFPVGNLIFLVVALGLSVAGSVLLWLRYRQPTSVMSSVDGFQREMEALGSPPRTPPGIRPTPPRSARQDPRPTRPRPVPGNGGGTRAASEADQQ